MTTASCTFCGKTGITFPHYCDNVDAPIDAPYCPAHLDGCPEPNRFDPFEALDTLDAIARDYEEDSPQAKSLLNALRAYITGMER